MPKLTVSITTKFSYSEAEQLRARAQRAGVPLRTYIRREMLSSELSPETTLVLAEIRRDREETRRNRELLTRLWSASSESPLDSHGVAEIAAQVEAIDGRLLVPLTKGAAQ